jgi:hypothetical protein
MILYLIVMVHGCDDVENESKVDGANTFYLSKFKIKIKSGGIFMFGADKVLHYTINNQNGNQYGVAFVQKTYVFKYLMNLNGQ